MCVCERWGLQQDLYEVGSDLICFWFWAWATSTRPKMQAAQKIKTRSCGNPTMTPVFIYVID